MFEFYPHPDMFFLCHGLHYGINKFVYAGHVSLVINDQVKIFMLIGFVWETGFLGILFSRLTFKRFLSLDFYPGQLEPGEGPLRHRIY